MKVTATLAYIDLAVTSKVIRQAANHGLGQRQIAIKGASRELQSKIGTARRDNRIVITIGDGGLLVAGDTGAIWPSHQETEFQQDCFTDLYEQLSQSPDESVGFVSN